MSAAEFPRGVLLRYRQGAAYSLACFSQRRSEFLLLIFAGDFLLRKGGAKSNVQVPFLRIQQPRVPGVFLMDLVSRGDATVTATEDAEARS